MANIKVATNLLDSPAHTGPGRFGRLVATHLAPLGVDLLPTHALPNGADAYLGTAIINQNIINYAKQNSVPLILRLDGVGELYPYGTYNGDFPNVTHSHCNADYVIYQSEFARDYVQTQTRFTPSKYRVILNGIDVPPLNHSVGEPMHFISICNVWTQFRYTIFEQVVVNNLDRILEEFPDFKWTVIGKTEEFRNRIGPNADRIRWVGFTPDLAAERANAFGVIHLVGKDSCPNSLIESMSCGLPSIVWHQSGGPEIAGDAGVTILDYKPKSIIEAIRTIRDNHINMMFRAHQRILNECNILDTAVKYKQVIEEAIDDAT